LAVVAALLVSLAAALLPSMPDAAADGGFEGSVALTGAPSPAPGSVEAGGSVEAVLSLEGPPTAAEVTAAAGLSEDLVLDPSSVDVPSGWSSAFSSTGPAGPFDDPLDTSTTGIEVRSPLLPGDGLGATQPAPSTAMVASVGQGTSRGFLPVLAGDRVFNVLHHSGVGDRELDCADRVTGTTCPGYPMELHVSAADDLYTPFAATGWVDDAGLLWFSAVHNVAGNSDQGGFFCFDTNTDAPCAQRWFPIATVTAGSAGVNEGRAPVSTIGRDGDRLYMVSMRAAAPSVAQRVSVTCFDTVTRTQCGQVNLGDTTTPSWESPTVTLRAPRLLSHQAGTRMHFVIDYGLFSAESSTVFGGSASRLLCFDSSTSARCASWPASVAVPGTTGSDLLRSVGSMFTNPSAPSSICAFTSRATPVLTATTSGLVFVNTLQARTANCWDAAGALGAVPAGLQALVDGTPTTRRDSRSCR
jgi:hypothetical protein